MMPDLAIFLIVGLLFAILWQLVAHQVPVPSV
jgi:hypothetical protein